MCIVYDCCVESGIECQSERRDAAPPYAQSLGPAPSLAEGEGGVPTMGMA